MVRLKAMLAKEFGKAAGRFQFQNGTIKRLKKQIDIKAMPSVSIPKWYD